MMFRLFDLFRANCLARLRWCAHFVSRVRPLRCGQADRTGRKGIGFKSVFAAGASWDCRMSKQSHEKTHAGRCSVANINYCSKHAGFIQFSLTLDSCSNLLNFIGHPLSQTSFVPLCHRADVALCPGFLLSSCPQPRRTYAHA